VNKKLLTLVLVSGFSGALITWLLVGAHQPKRHSASAGPEKFVPAQTLALADSTGRQFAELTLGSDRSVTFNLADADENPLVMYTSASNGEILWLKGIPQANGQLPFLNVLMSPGEPAFMLFPGNGRGGETKSKSWQQGNFLGVAKAVYQAAFPGEPEHTVEDIIPTEDIRLVDRSGNTFAVFGLTDAGEPGFGLLDSDGRLLMSFALSEPGYFPNANESKQWPNIWLFDSRGKLRVMIELGPEPEPLLTIYENTDTNKPDPGVYVLDPQTGQEIRKQNLFSRKEGAIPWLQHKMFKAALPIVLIDQRGQLIWSSKGSRT
jgi:hypothetical protein